MIYFKHFVYSKAPFYIFLFLILIATITFLVEVVFEEFDKKMKRAKSRDNGKLNKHFEEFSEAAQFKYTKT